MAAALRRPLSTTIATQWRSPNRVLPNPLTERIAGPMSPRLQRWLSQAAAEREAQEPRPQKSPGHSGGGGGGSRLFSYDIAASYIAKDRAYDPATHVFHFSPYNHVQPPPRRQQRRAKASRPESGQDAFFVSRVGSGGGGGVEGSRVGADASVALGVADGVGGWTDSGVDPADFAHGLCEAMAAAAYHRGPTSTSTSTPASSPPTSSPPPSQPPPASTDATQPPPPAQPLTARRLMQQGYDAVCADPGIPAGGSTAVVGLLSPAGALEVANLGDSGFLQLRQAAVHAFSQPQVHAFNTPFQLSVVPAALLRRATAFGGARQLADLPSDAEVSRHAVRHGDVLVFASDGLWDNLFNQDILRIVSGAMTRVGAWVVTDAGITVAEDLSALTSPSEDGDAGGRAAAGDGGAKSVGDGDSGGKSSKGRPGITLQSLLATEITGAAKAASVNAQVDGPFAKEVKKYYPLETWRGGKVDDICVVVVVVSEVRDRPAATPIKSRL